MEQSVLIDSLYDIVNMFVPPYCPACDLAMDKQMLQVT